MLFGFQVLLITQINMNSNTTFKIKSLISITEYFISGVLSSELDVIAV